MSYNGYVKCNSGKSQAWDIKILENYLCKHGGAPITPVGSQLSYGDACIGDLMISSKLWNRIISFDQASGVVEAESGVTIQELLQVTLTSSWFLYVTPGTRYITLGGAVASDVHGKNHPAKGNFSSYVLYFDIMVGSGKIFRCSKVQNARLFWLTCGGMGNTGIILKVALQMRKLSSLYMETCTQKNQNFESVFQSLMDKSQWEYASAWIDFMAKGKNVDVE